MNRAGPNNFYMGRGGPNMYTGQGALHGQGIPHGKLMRMLRAYKTANRIDHREHLPIHHMKYLMEEGASGRGGFLPLAALIPLIASAASYLGPPLAAGAAGALGGYAVKKITGQGLSSKPIARPLLPAFLQYHPVHDTWTTGAGIGNLFKSLASKFGNLLSNKHVRRIGEASKNALVKSTVDALEELGTNKPTTTTAPKRAVGRQPTKRQPATKKQPTTKRPKSTAGTIVQTSLPEVSQPIPIVSQSNNVDPYQQMLLQGTGYHQYPRY